MEQYHIIKKIGSGSYGDVWKAITEKTNEVVAIKKLKRRFRSAEECINLGEFKALRKMKHPNIVTLKQMIIEENGTVFMVFECMGCSLYNRLIEKRYFSEDEIKKMCFQIFKGLECWKIRTSRLLTNQNKTSVLIRVKNEVKRRCKYD